VERSTFWSLTVHYYPAAAAAGLRPVENESFALDGPQYYRPHRFDFANPPRREDFLAVCRKLPWTHVWNDTLLPVLERNPWPIMDSFHKANSQDLFDEQGRQVGRLNIYKEEAWLNRAYLCPHVSSVGDIATRLINRMYRDPAERRAAKDFLLTQENRIREELVNTQLPDLEDIHSVMKKVLKKRKNEAHARS
jgi:hypothetical protein